MSIRVIPKSVKEETGHHALERLHHTPYRDEVRLFSCLQRGDPVSYTHLTLPTTERV